MKRGRLRKSVKFGSFLVHVLHVGLINVKGETWRFPSALLFYFSIGLDQANDALSPVSVWRDREEWILHC